MEVILIKDVPNLGEIGELVRVKPGYGRNYLFPQKLAVPASTKDKKRLEHEKRVAQHQLAKAREGDVAIQRQISNMTLTIRRKVGEQNKLYGSVTSSDIAAALREQGVNFDRRRIPLEEPFKA